MREIFAPVIAMTITLAAVYAPIGFAQGLTGALFREFAVTLAGAVVISGFIAVTLSPMLAARVLKPHGAGASRFQRIVDRSFDRVSDWYGRRVAATLDYRPVTLMIVAALSATMVFLFLNTSSELAPEEDIGFMFSIVNAPRLRHLRLHGGLHAARSRDATRGRAGGERRFSVVGFGGTNTAFAGFGLVPWAERDAQPGGDAAGRAEPAQRRSPACRPSSSRRRRCPAPAAACRCSTSSARPATPTRSSRSPRRSRTARRRAAASSSCRTRSPSRSRRRCVTIDRDRAAALGVPVSEIGTTLTALVGGGSVSKFDRESRSYDVITQVRRADRFNPESLGDYYVRSASGSDGAARRR